MNWKETKKDGSGHYKTGGVEPLDLYRDSGMLRDFALASIIKYAFRNSKCSGRTVDEFIKDMNKIIHYAEILKSLLEDRDDNTGKEDSV